MIAIWALLSGANADTLELIPNDPAGRQAPGDVCDRPLCESLVQLIDKAKAKVDLAFYGFRNQTAIFEAAKRAAARGVVVRVVVDKDLAGENYYDSTVDWLAAFKVRDDHAADVRAAANQRSFFGAPKCPRPDGFAGPLQCNAFDFGDACYLAAHASREDIEFKGDIMHHKFAVVDDRFVWTGSANASDSGTGAYNANLVIAIDSPTVAGWYTTEFESMYVGGKFHAEKAKGSPRRTWIVENQVHVSAYFSPQDRTIQTAVRPLIQQARERIDIAVFFLTHKKLAQDLIDAKNRGVAVRVIIDATAAKNGYTKHQVLREAGIPVKVETWGGKMHAKSAVIDGETVIGGSMNWTSAGEYKNDENTLIIRSKSHGALYQKWFDGLWQQLDEASLTGRPDPESQASGTACTDGVDNDFDHLADADDPGCGASPPPLPALPEGRRVAKKPGQPCSWALLEE